MIVKQKNTLYDILYPGDVVNFIANSFDEPDIEKKSISSALKNNNNRCFLILDRKTKVPVKADEKHCYKDEVVAAAICQFHLSGCYLLWFATMINKKQIKEI